MAGSKKISELNTLTSVSGDDLLVIVDDPSGTAVTKKVTVSTFLSNASIGKIVANASVGSANQILSSNGSGIYWSSDLNISTINVASGALYANSVAVYAANVVAITVNASANINTTTLYGNVSAGYVNVDGQVNTTTLYVTTSANVGTAFIANATGAYHTGLVNAANFTTTGTVNTVTVYATGLVNAASYNAGTIGVSNGFISNSTYLSFGNSSSNAAMNTSSLSLSSLFNINKESGVPASQDVLRTIKFSIPTTTQYQSITGSSAVLRTGSSSLPASFNISTHVSDFTNDATAAGQTQTYLDPVFSLGWNITGYGSTGLLQNGMSGLGLFMEYDYYATSLVGQVSETYFQFITEPLPKALSADTVATIRTIEFQNIMEKQKSFNITGISSTGSNTSIVINTTGTHPNYSILTVGETLHIAGITGTYSTALNGKKLRLIAISGTWGSSITLTCDFQSTGTYTSGGTVAFYPQGRGTNMGLHAPYFYFYTGDFNDNYKARKRDDSGDLFSNERKFLQLSRGGMWLYQVDKNQRVDLNLGDQNQNGDPFNISTYANWPGSGLSIGPTGSRCVTLSNYAVTSAGVQGYLEITGQQLFSFSSGIYGTPSTPTIRIPGDVYDSVSKENGNGRLPALWAHAGSLPPDNSAFIVSPGSSTTRTPTASTQGADKYIVRFDARTAVWNDSSPPTTHKTYLTNEGWWFVGNSVSTPSINPVNGGYLYVDGADKKLKFRGINGVITILTPTV